MKIMKLIIFAVAILSFNICTAQTAPPLTAREIRAKITMLVHNASPKEKVTYDTVDHHITIGRYDIPYMTVAYSYKYLVNTFTKSKLVDFVKMNCPDDPGLPSLEHNCIRLAAGKIDTTFFVPRNGGYYCNACTVPFVSKEDAMAFMGLIAELKKRQ